MSTLVRGMAGGIQERVEGSEFVFPSRCLAELWLLSPRQASTALVGGKFADVEGAWLLGVCSFPE